MQSFKRPMVAIGAFRNLAYKIIPKSPAQEYSSRIYQHGISLSSPNAAKFTVFDTYSSVSQRLGLGFQLATKRVNYNPFLGGGVGNRFYSVEACILAGYGALISVYFYYLESVPFLKRKRFLPVFKFMEKNMGEHQFEVFKAKYKGKFLPPMHPDSVRVRLIAKHIIEAWQRKLRKERMWGFFTERSSRETSSVWVQNLDGVIWEVLVVDDPLIDAVYFAGGKIVLFNGLLLHFKTDAEIATIIAVEVASIVARHPAEVVTKCWWYYILPDTYNKRFTLYCRLILEADCIGLFLMASAGYDPRIAVEVSKKGAEIRGYPSLRSQHLENTPFMEKALSLYKKKSWTRD